MTAKRRRAERPYRERIGKISTQILLDLVFDDSDIETAIERGIWNLELLKLQLVDDGLWRSTADRRATVKKLPKSRIK